MLLETPKPDPLEKNQVFLPLSFFFFLDLGYRILADINFFFFLVGEQYFGPNVYGCINNCNGSPLVLGVFNLNHAFIFTYFG